MTRGNRANNGVAEAASQSKKSAREGAKGEAGRVPLPEDVVSDDELARRVRKGDDAAWDILVQRYKHFIFRCCWNSVGNTAIAEEVAQDVWLRLWESRLTIRDGGFGGRIIRIMRNLCIDYSRKAEHRFRGELAPGQTLSDAGDTYITVPEEISVKMWVEELLALLPPQERRVLLKLYMQGMTLDETGASEGYTHVAIGQIRNRALARILAFISRGKSV